MVPKTGVMNIVIGIPSRSGRRAPPEWGICLAAQSWPINSIVHHLIVKANVLDVARGLMTTARQRNEIVMRSLDADAKYILFMDDDTSPPPGSLIHAFSILEQQGPPLGDVMAVTGIYVTRRDPCEPVLFRRGHQGAFWNWKVNTVFDVDGCGAGCFLVGTGIFKELPSPWFEGQHGNEDVNFCEKLRDAGYRILAHGGILCAHWDAKEDKAWVLPVDSPPFREVEVNDANSSDHTHDSQHRIQVG
jgi:hypothetical protein